MGHPCFVLDVYLDGTGGPLKPGFGLSGVVLLPDIAFLRLFVLLRRPFRLDLDAFLAPEEQQVPPLRGSSGAGPPFPVIADIILTEAAPVFAIFEGRGYRLPKTMFARCRSLFVKSEDHASP